MVLRCMKTLVFLLLVVLAARLATPAGAAKGVPGSPAFGYGVAIYPDAPLFDEALALLNVMQPDWIYVPVSWAAMMHAEGSQPDYSAIDQVMAAAAQRDIAVAVSISDAPAWAMSARGPAPQHAARLAVGLVQRYPDTMLALELFPRANLQAGWGSAPDPQAYVAVFQAVRAGLDGAKLDVLLVAGGLQPLAQDQAALDPALGLDDLVFLQGLYTAGGSAVMPVISMQYADVNNDLLASPFDTPGLLFRHYERVRALMLANGHEAGQIWVTGFHIPSGQLGEPRLDPNSVEQQKTWLQQGYAQLYAQLYIGTAVLESLNPAPSGAGGRTVSLLQPDQTLHPFTSVFQSITQENKAGPSARKPGRAKEGSLLKNRLYN